MADMDWDRAWDETFDLVKSILFPEKNLGPPDWWKKMDENPLKPLPPEQATGIMGAMQRMQMGKRSNEPGSMALDFIPQTHRTQKEHEAAAKYWSEKGYTYRPPPEANVKASEIPKGTLTLPAKRR